MEENIERRVVNLKEALTFMFKEGNLSKFLIMASICGILSLIVVLLSPSGFKENNFNIFQWSIATLISFINVGISFIFTGYMYIYQFDRAHDKNAKFRNFKGNILDSFFVFAKLFCAMLIYGILYYLITYLVIVIFMILSGILSLALKWVGVAISVLSGIALIIAGLYLLFKFIFSIIPFVVKDLKLSSWFKVPDAFRFAKDVHYGAPVILTVILLPVAFIITFILFFLTIVFANNIFISALRIIFILVISFGGIYMGAIFANIFGQFSYNAIEKVTGVSPETLPKELINKDKSSVIISVVTMVCIHLFWLLIMIVMIIAMPTLIKEQKKAEAALKVEKAVVNYENVAAVYMVENEKNDVYGMIGSNCKNVSKYFKVEKRKGCHFIMQDGTYWHFKYDGSAKISDNYEEPLKTVKVGVCRNGVINCEETYPDAYNMDSNSPKGESGFSR